VRINIDADAALQQTNAVTVSDVASSTDCTICENLPEPPNSAVWDSRLRRPLDARDRHFTVTLLRAVTMTVGLTFTVAVT
jgi:hypothetical protein